MRDLFMMECKKTARGVLYWLYVLALFLVIIRRFDATVDDELRGKDGPSSVFYTAADGIYAGDSVRLSDAEMQENMMAGATARLLDSYRRNAYEYYPFGYVKTKTMSKEGQRVILSYLEELTGMSEEAINRTAVEDGAEDFQIYGGGAFVFEPGQGSINENGQYVIEPGDWKYIENNADITGESENPESSFEKVTFDRFREIMGEVDAMIGRNSYFGKEMLTLYYCENDMEESPVTGQQHREFYEGDHVTGAFARYYCDSISLLILGLPALVVIELMMRDKKSKMQALVYQRTVSGIRMVCTRYAASVCMVMLPVLIFPIKSLMTLVRFCSKTGVQPDVFAFAKYSLLWILPTILLVMAIGLFMTVLTENYSGILCAGLLWLAGRPSIGKIAGGNYDLFDLIIRHNTLKGYGRMMGNIRMLVMNRAAVSGMAFLFVALSVVVYEARRKGVGNCENRKLFNCFRSEHPHEL
ncbi:MAG: hypothetical protein K2N85_02790 [Lachnospiraceae bacterium]|nr:hypothetical protein [Lachnospiraceae bacterium]